MNAQLVLYLNSKILESENFIVDNIQSYLSTLIFRSFTIQYYDASKMDVSIKIKALSENDNASQVLFNDYNYARINHSNKTLYYFVRKISYISPMTYQLDLHLDVLNSYYESNKSAISPLTHITRQHKDRFREVYLGHGAVTWLANIDKYSEGILPKLYKDKKVVVNQTIDDNSVYQSYYLMYKNSNYNSEASNNVVNCFLVFENYELYKITHTENITPEQLNPSYSYFLIPYYTGAITINRQGGNTYNIPANSNFMVIVYKSGNLIQTNIRRYDDHPTPPFDTTAGSEIERFTDVESIHVNTNSRVYFDTTNILITIPSRQAIYSNYAYYTTGGTIDHALTTYNNVNKSDSRIIKIIKLPYLPTDGFYHDGEGVLKYDTDKWRVNESEQLLQLNDLNIKFEQSIFNYSQRLYDDNTGDNKLYPLSSTPFDNSSFPKALTDLRGTAPEPKIYHSDFFYWKYIYDSFTKVVNNEKYLTSYYNLSSNNIYFYTTSTINSRFMFKFDFMKEDSSYQPDMIEEDFHDYLIVQRNNEETLYNSEYINYIKAGFNYDVKNKQRQEAFSWVATGASMIAGIASVAVGSKTLGIGLISSSVMGIASSINTTIQLETNMEQRLNQLKWQGNSVYGADDVDLMTRYNNNNKLWRARYKVSPRMEIVLKDLFYYTGYIDDVNEIPNLETRMWFNFVQCEIHFKDCPLLNKEQLEEYKGKFLGGVTKLHSNTIDGTPTWDFDRVRENWESVFFNNN